MGRVAAVGFDLLVLVLAMVPLAGGGTAAEPGSLPRVLLIGDHGWGPKSPPGASGLAEHVARRLAGRAVVVRSPESGATTAKAVASVPKHPDALRLDAWLGTEPWDVIHFSFGLHDAKLDDAGRPAVSLEAFSRNLEQIADRLEQTGAALVWASATPVAEGGGRRRTADIEQFNAAARKIMDRRGIPVNDLHAAAAGRLDEWFVPGSPHFNATGAEALAAEVSAAVEAALGP
jgi:lysophospholipase L1-like esterase